MLRHSDRQKSLLEEKEWVARNCVDGHTWSDPTGQHYTQCILIFRLIEEWRKRDLSAQSGMASCYIILPLGRRGDQSFSAFPIEKMMVKREEIRD